METQPSCVRLFLWDQALPPAYPEMPSLSLSGPVTRGAQLANRQLPAGRAQHWPGPPEAKPLGANTDVLSTASLPSGENKQTKFP